MVIKEDKLTKLMTLGKTACFGKCATYDMTIYNQGIAIINAKDNIPLSRGIYYMNLPNDFMTSLKQKINAPGWETIKNKYEINIPDLPYINLHLYYKDTLKNKLVSSNTNAPKQVQEVIELANDLVKSKQWIQIQKKDDLINPDIVYTELMINIDTAMSIQKLETEFADYKLIHSRKLSPYMNFWLMTYDINKISPYEIMTLLTKYPGVHSVRFNRKLQSREE